MTHTPLDPRLRAVLDAVPGATCTMRCLSSHPTQKLVGLHIEVVAYGDQLVFINPVTQLAEALDAHQIGGPITRSS